MNCGLDRHFLDALTVYAVAYTRSVLEGLDVDIGSPVAVSGLDDRINELNYRRVIYALFGAVRLFLHQSGVRVVLLVDIAHNVGHGGCGVNSADSFGDRRAGSELGVYLHSRLDLQLFEYVEVYGVVCRDVQSAVVDLIGDDAVFLCDRLGYLLYGFRLDLCCCKIDERYFQSLRQCLSKLCLGNIAEIEQHITELFAGLFLLDERIFEMLLRDIAAFEQYLTYGYVFHLLTSGFSHRSGLTLPV